MGEQPRTHLLSGPSICSLLAVAHLFQIVLMTAANPWGHQSWKELDASSCSRRDHLRAAWEVPSPKFLAHALLGIISRGFLQLCGEDALETVPNAAEDRLCPWPLCGARN